jgi:general secretion pathway protein A
MYLEFFGFREKPFTITPNPRFIFLSKNHKDAFAHLLYGISNRCGFIELTGEVGAGKTTVLRTLLEQLEGDEYRLSFIFNPSLSAPELLQGICREFRIEIDDGEVGRPLDQLNAFLLQENAAGRTVVLVIDEAQNLAPPVLEQIRLLSNLETASDKLIQIVLAGQPELGRLLERPDLRQLNQRITVRYHLGPMDFEDTRSYIRHRLDLAGNTRHDLFPESTIRDIFRFSRGLPRLINLLCDRALLVAFSEDRHQVERNSVAQARRELKREGTVKVPWWGLLGAGLVLVGFLAFFFGRPQPESAGPQIETPPAQAAAGEPAPDHRMPTAETEGTDLISIRSGLEALGERESAALAVDALFRRWQEPGLESAMLTVPDGLRQTTKSRNLTVTPYTGGLDQLLNLDSPVLLELALPGVSGLRYLAVIARDPGGFEVAPAPLDRSRLSPEELQGLWTGSAWLLWRNHSSLPYLATPGEVRPQIRILQEILTSAGLYEGVFSGVYDPRTIAGVTLLQARRGIIQDGRVGPQTLILLSQEAPGFDPPRLERRGAGEGG